MKLGSILLSLTAVLLFASHAKAQNYTITLYDSQNGSGNVVMTYTGSMLNVTQNGTLVQGFVTNPATMQWNTPPIPLDGQAGSLNPCNVAINNNGPNGEAIINCESAAPGTTNGVPLFSFCFQGVQWPMPVGTYNVDGAHFSSCGNYFVAHPQISGYGFAFAQLNSGSIVVALAQGGTWSTRAPMPTARYSTGIGVVNGIIYVMGGTTSVTSSGSNIAALEAYDPTSNTWSTKAPMPTPRHSFGVSVVNGILYTVGGYAFSCLCSVPTVEAYDPRTDTWVTKAPMPTARNGLATGVVNGSIYAAGGNSPSSPYLATVEAYDPVSDTWSTKASMPTARYEPAAGVVDDVLYVVGGSYYGSLSTLEGYDATTDTWSAKSPMPTPRYYLGSGILNELLYAVGGHNGSIALSSVEAYDPTTQSWTEVTPMPTPRLPLVAVVNGTLYAIGGYDYVHGIPLSTVEAFTPTTPGAAQLNGGNTLTGNQTVNGSLSATSFIGDGSGLTGVVAQVANTANTANTANYANTAGTAASATFAASAGDALTLSGNLPSAFAPASGSANYVAKGGDTMTGTLNLVANGLIAGNTQLALSGGNVGIGTASPSAPLHVHNGTSTLSSLVDGNMVALFENTAGGATNVWLNTKAANAGGVAEDYYFEVNGVGTGGLRYNVGGDYVALTTDVTPSGVNNEPFVLKGRNVGIGTTNPTAQLDVNGAANFRGPVTFAPSQTFPGAGNGTITGVAAGTGLSGGGTSGNITLNLNTGFTDARYLSLGGGSLTGSLSALSFTGVGSGLTGLNPANIAAGAANININGNAVTATTAGSAANAFALGGVAATNYALLASPAFTGTPTAPTATAGTNTAQVATTAYVNNPNNIYSGWHQAEGIGGFLVAPSDQGKLISAGLTNVTLPASLPPIGWWVDVQNHGPSSVTLNPNGNNLDYSPSTLTLAANQGLRIVSGGSGEGYFTQRGTGSSLSMTFSLSVPSLKPSTCTTSPFTFNGVSDGDTTALGVPNILMTAGTIIYSVWVNAANTVTIRSCNVNPNGPATTAASGTIRVDIWKH